MLLKLPLLLLLLFASGGYTSYPICEDQKCALRTRCRDFQRLSSTFELGGRALDFVIQTKMGFQTGVDIIQHLQAIMDRDSTKTLEFKVDWVLVSMFSLQDDVFDLEDAFRDFASSYKEISTL